MMLNFRIGLLVMLLVGNSLCFGSMIPDDHGNKPADATVMNGPSNAISGGLQFDTDVDVFSFPFLPMRSYVIRVNTGTVWDVKLEIVPPAFLPLHVSTNTAWTNTPVSVTWTNQGAAARWYLAVSGMFNFTTGTYSIAVWEAPFNQDADGDGIGDAWEMAYFGTTNAANSTSSVTGGGFLDLHTYLAGVNPFDGGLRVKFLSLSAIHDVVGWTNAAHATYDIHAATNIYGPWIYQGRQVAGGSAGWMAWTNDPGPYRQRYYRIQFIY